jgi:hypothetical protein
MGEYFIKNSEKYNTYTHPLPFGLSPSLLQQKLSLRAEALE